MYKNPVEVHKELFNKNGRSLIPPKWMFGPWLQVHTHTSESIPVRSDVLLKTDDIPYSHSINIGQYYFPSGCCFDQESIERLTTENELLLNSGIASTAYFNSMVDHDWGAGFSEAKTADILLKNADNEIYTFTYNDKGTKNVSLLDFSDENAGAWFASKMQVAIDSKFSGFMYDYGEYVPPFSVNSKGQNGFRYHNEYPLDYQKVAFEFFTGVDSDDDEKMKELHYAPEEMFYVRSGYVGTQKYRKGFFFQRTKFYRK